MSTSMPGKPVSPRPWWRRRIVWNTASVFAFLVLVVASLAFWANSAQFESLVRKRLESQLTAATGGKVQIGWLHWSLLHLEADAGGIVIHGEEDPGESPYAQIDRLRIRMSILGFMSPRVLLRDLEIVRPQFHLIVYPDGATNQPHPARPSQLKKPVMDMLFELEANHIAVENGLIDLDDRAAALDFQDRFQPLDFRGDDVSLLLRYVPAAGQSQESYRIDAGIRDLDLARGGTLKTRVAPVHGYIQASLDLMRDSATLRSLRITASTHGAPDRTLNVRGWLRHFHRPEWAGWADGELDLRLLDPTLGYAFAPEGILQLNLAAAGKGDAFQIDSDVHAAGAAYVGTGVVARGIELNSKVHADANELHISSIAVRLKQGGSIDGDLRLVHWLPVLAPQTIEAAPETSRNPSAPSRKKKGIRTPPPPADLSTFSARHGNLVMAPATTIPVDGTVDARFHNVSIDTILDLVSQPPFQRLGLSSLLNGPAKATWVRGDVNTLQVGVTLSVSGTNPGQNGESPAMGEIDATYAQRNGSVDVRTLSLNLPHSHLIAHGVLGAYPLTSPTDLNVDFESRDLGEFDAALRDLGLKRNGKAGASALPVFLGGEADFRGTWEGSLISPRLAGHLKSNNVAIEIPENDPKTGQARTVHFDSVEADCDYDAERIIVAHGVMQRGDARLAVDGTLTAEATGGQVSANLASPAAHRAAPNEMPAFDANSLLHVRVHANSIAIQDVLPLVGQDLPVTGMLDAQLTADGTIRAMNGSGQAELSRAQVYGEPINRLRMQGSFINQVLKLNSFSVENNAGTVTGSGSYDIHSQRFEAEAHGSAIDVAKITRLEDVSNVLQGKLSFSMSAAGTKDNPNLQLHASLAEAQAQGEPLNGMTIAAYTQGRTLHYGVSTELASAQINLHGATELNSDYSTQASVDFSHFDIGSAFRLTHVKIPAESALEGSASIQGPAARPKEMHGEVRLKQLAVSIAGVELKSDGVVHAALSEARVKLDPVHITGDQTDMNVQGSLGLATPRKLDIAASGSVNLKLAETLDPDLTAGGTARFQVEAHGPLSNPGLQGRVDFQDGSLSLEDLPNGLSQLQGTLEFNQNRLEVRTLTAMTGGGLIGFKGFLAYQHGIYADLSVSGKSIRIRYPQGVSSVADADLRLQGTQGSLLLSGGVMITRFSISPDLDIASLALQANVVQPIPPADAPSNHIRLDVHIQSSPQLSFQNAYAKLAGDVDLHLRGTLASPTLLGSVSVTEGTAQIAGVRYELHRGELIFNNPVRIQPTIDLSAMARVDDYDITLGLHGTTDKLNISYRSDPPLPQADVVALLALGRTQSEQGVYTQQQQSAGFTPSTDVLLGGALNATVSNRVQKLFGAGSVKVDPSYLGSLGNSTTRITVDEQLGKYVTLTYATNVDTTAQQLLQAEIAINRHVSIVVARDESGVFSMVIKAVRRYK